MKFTMNWVRITNVPSPKCITYVLQPCVKNPMKSFETSWVKQDFVFSNWNNIAWSLGPTPQFQPENFVGVPWSPLESLGVPWSPWQQPRINSIIYLLLFIRILLLLRKYIFILYLFNIINSCLLYTSDAADE